MDQRRRLYAALIYLGGFSGLSWTLFDRLLPPLGASGTWFYAGAALVLLAVALTEPHYAAPAQALGNALALLLLATTFSLRAGIETGASQSAILFGKRSLLAYSVIVISIAMTAILTKDRGGKAGAISATSARWVRSLGSGRTIYSTVYLSSVYAVYSRLPAEAAALVAAWIIVVVMRPAEHIVSLDREGLTRSPVGVVTALRHPGLAEVRCYEEVQPGDRLIIKPDVEATVLDAAPSGDALWALVSGSESGMDVGAEVIQWVPKSQDVEAPLGPVQPGSTITDIRFRVPGATQMLKEGSLVSVAVRGQKVLYQVVSARAERETLSSAIEHRYVEAIARKIGAWNPTDRRFSRVPWLPVPGDAVSLEALQDPEFQSDSIGCIPDTQYGVRMDPDLMVTHNTAILGILGIGKTYLAFELIRRIVASGVKVLVFDITGEYAPMFRDLFPEEGEKNSLTAISTAIAATRNSVSQHVHLGGNIVAFRQAVGEDLKGFLEGDLRLKVVNPGAFDVTRQDSKLFSGSAALAPLTMVEATRVFSEELLQLLSQKMSSVARVCAVLEEAHSLVPEWNSTTYSGDQQASNATAKAVLQGRKYGLGVLLITQRTANVTKTILNQCNTIFALRTFDATGMDFLRNYIGDEYSDVLSGLEDRSAVVFGRASSCPSPVLIGLNDHDQMMDGFWNPEGDALEDPSVNPP